MRLQHVRPKYIRTNDHLTRIEILLYHYMVPNGQNYKNLKTLENHFYIFIEASNWQSHLEIVLRKGHFLFSFSMFLQILMVYYTDRDLLDSSLLIQENATV